jgi:endoglycosylceramidase
VVRPYARATAGLPVRMSYAVRTGTFVFEFVHDPAIDAPTEIRIPRFPYPDGWTTELSDGRAEAAEEGQVLRYAPATPGGLHRIVIRPKRGSVPRRADTG